MVSDRTTSFHLFSQPPSDRWFSVNCVSGDHAQADMILVDWKSVDRLLGFTSRFFTLSTHIWLGIGRPLCGTCGIFYSNVDGLTNDCSIIKEFPSLYLSLT